ncbi:hypothetical protein [Geodermatophilus sp. SYSU D00698]
MYSGQRTRTFRLPGGVLVTVVPLKGAANEALLRAAATHASLYLLVGLVPADPEDPWNVDPPNWAIYVGMSAELQVRLRAGVSLRQWATMRGLNPRLAILIRRERRPLSADVTVLAETLLIRDLFTADRWVMLNSVASCPTVARRLPRHQVAYTLHLVTTLLDFLNGRVLPRGTGSIPMFGPSAGSIREQLVRLVRTCARPMTSAEVVAEATARGIPIDHHGQPTQTARRDLTTRERRGARGPVRVHHTYVRGPSGRREALFYLPGVARRDALRQWQGQRDIGVQRPRPTRRRSRRP